jgi:hypothetical protein
MRPAAEGKMIAVSDFSFRVENRLQFEFADYC